jgi:hypothetical protein
VGRDEGENAFLRAEAEPGDLLLEVHEYIGPLTVLRGAATDADVRTAAALTGCYSKRPQPNPATIRCWSVPEAGREPAYRFVTVPLPPRESFIPLRIGDLARSTTSGRPSAASRTAD